MDETLNARVREHLEGLRGQIKTHERGFDMILRDLISVAEEYPHEDVLDAIWLAGSFARRMARRAEKACERHQGATDDEDEG